MPVGTILPYVGSLSDIPNGWKLCDGTNGTPNLTGRFLQGWGNDGYVNHHLNENIPPGLPNFDTSGADFYAPIGGYFDNRYFGKQIDNSFGYNGATYDGKYSNGIADAAIFSRTSGGGGFMGLWMDKFSKLLKNGIIYGKSNTVQPRAYVVYYIVKIF